VIAIEFWVDRGCIGGMAAATAAVATAATTPMATTAVAVAAAKSNFQRALCEIKYMSQDGCQKGKENW